MWSAYWARSAWRTARFKDSWAPRSVRTLRLRTRTGSRRSWRARRSHRSIVERPKRTGKPVIGCGHSRAASFSSSARSSPSAAVRPIAVRPPRSGATPIARGGRNVLSVSRCTGSSTGCACTVKHPWPADDLCEVTATYFTSISPDRPVCGKRLPQSQRLVRGPASRPRKPLSPTPSTATASLHDKLSGDARPSIARLPGLA
jgi:hypothetical protein